MPFVYIFPVMKICERMSCSGSVSPFQPRNSLLLYADRSWSPGRLQPSLVCQVAMPGQGQEVSGPRSSKSPRVTMLGRSPLACKQSPSGEKGK